MFAKLRSAVAGAGSILSVATCIAASALVYAMIRNIRIPLHGAQATHGTQPADVPEEFLGASAA
jgi:hypothetical protein